MNFLSVHLKVSLAIKLSQNGSVTIETRFSVTSSICLSKGSSLAKPDLPDKPGFQHIKSIRDKLLNPISNLNLVRK